MRDELLVATDDPGEVADAALAAGTKAEHDRQPGRIRQRFGGLSARGQLGVIGQLATYALGLGKVEAEQVAAVVGHRGEASGYSYGCANVTLDGEAYRVEIGTRSVKSSPHARPADPRRARRRPCPH